MAGGRVKHPKLVGPNLIKEIAMAIAAGLVAGGIWKQNQWSNQKKSRMFYDMLEKGEVSVIAEE